MVSDRVLRALETNDPAVTELNLDEVTDEVARPLSQALAGNTVVTKLRLVLSTLSLDGVRGLALFIVRSTSLRGLEINGRESFRETAAAVAVIDQLVVAAGCSRTIEYLHLNYFCECTDMVLVNCLRGLRQSLKDLKVPKLANQAADLWDFLANTIFDLPLLESLDIDNWRRLRGLANMVLERLADQPNPRELAVGDFAHQNVAQNLGNVLRSNTPLEKLRLKFPRDNPDDRHHRTVFQALHRHPTVRELTVWDYYTADDSFGAHVAAMLQNNHTMEFLTVNHTNLPTAIAILEALDDSTEDEREAFWMGVVNIINQGLAPQLKELALELFPPPTDQCKEALVEALKNNKTLHQVRISPPHLPLTMLEYFGMRNKYGPHLPLADAPPDAHNGMAASKWWLPDFFERLRGPRDVEVELSVMYDTLRGRSDWVPVTLASNKRKQTSSS